MGEERRQCWRDHSRPQYGLGSSSDKPGSLRRLLRQHHLQWDYVHRFCRRKGVCNGDSGGTLNIRQSEGGNKWTQVGVTSFVSSAGCESGNPHGFSRVAEHLEWIETVTGLSLI